MFNFKTFLEVSDNFFNLVYSFGEIPREQIKDILLQNNKGYGMDFQDRETFTSNFSWAIPCKEAVEVIKKYAREPLYDVIAGTGYWTKILKKAGINVIASDMHNITSKNYYHMPGDRFIPKKEKEKINRRNALKVGYHIKTGRLKGDILISWPPYEKPFATDLLELLPIGARVFYIGEGFGGCTGDASFHKFLCINFKHLHKEELPRWQGIHDSLNVYEKVSNNPVDQRLRGKGFMMSYDNDDD